MIGINEIEFNDKGTYSDFGLFMTGRTIGRAPLKRKSIDVPWRDGTLDYTQAGGRTFYDNRKLSFDFKLIDPDDFYSVYTALAEYVHGQNLRVVIPEDASYYYYGMCEVSNLDISKALGKITISVDAEPFKYSWSSSTEDIPWDNVNFEETYFHAIGEYPNYGEMAIDPNADYRLEPIGHEVVPVFIISNVEGIVSNSRIRVARRPTFESPYVNKYIPITGNGRYRSPDIVVGGGEYSYIRVQNVTSGTVRIEYKEAWL